MLQEENFQKDGREKKNKTEAINNTLKRCYNLPELGSELPSASVLLSGEACS